MANSADCPVCGAKVTVDDDTEAGEIMTCAECSSELEVVKVSPLELDVAPEEEEDWGE